MIESCGSPKSPARMWMLLAALPCVRLMKSTWALQAVGACTWGKSVLLSQWEWVAACLSALWWMSASLCRVASSANFTSRKVWSEHSEQSHSIFFIFFIDAVRECESFLNALQRQRKPATFFFFAPLGFFYFLVLTCSWPPSILIARQLGAATWAAFERGDETPPA